MPGEGMGMGNRLDDEVSPVCDNVLKVRVEGEACVRVRKRERVHRRRMGREVMVGWWRYAGGGCVINVALYTRLHFITGLRKRERGGAALIFVFFLAGA